MNRKNNMRSAGPTRRTQTALLILVVIAGCAIIAAQPALAAPVTPGASAVPAEINITKAIAAMNAAFDAGNWPRAAAYAEVITTSDEHAPADVWCRWGYSLRMMGKYDKSLIAASAAVEKAPDSVEAYLNRGYTYLALGEYQNARLDAEEALALDSMNATAYHIIASGLLGQDDPKNALIAINTALAMDPDDARYLNTKGMVLMKMKKYGDAVTALTEATESLNGFIAPYPGIVSPEENLIIAQQLFDDNKAPVELIVIAALVILAVGAGAIFLQRRK